MAIRKNYSLRSCRNRQPGFRKSEEVMEHSEGGRRGDSASDRGPKREHGKGRCSQCIHCSGWPYLVTRGSSGGEKYVSQV